MAFHPDQGVAAILVSLVAAIFDEREAKLTAKEDPLVKLVQVIDFEDFRADLSRIRKKDRKSNAGRKPFDVVLMCKVLILQQMSNLSDDAIEYQICDRISFREPLKIDHFDRFMNATH
jgi:hypothetical protein